MREAVIVSSSRTALAKSFRGSFNLTKKSPMIYPRTASRMSCAKRRNWIPAEVEDVILGCGQPHGPQGHEHRQSFRAPRRSSHFRRRTHAQSLLLLRPAVDRARCFIKL